MKKHIELNDNNSPFTATATYYYGNAYWDIEAKTAFLRIADCHNIISIHANSNTIDTKEEQNNYIAKLRKLSSFIEEFADKLEVEFQSYEKANK